MSSEITHGDAGPSRKGYQKGCPCTGCRQVNAAYIQAWRERKRIEHLPDPPAPASPPPVVSAPTSSHPGPIEQALADDLARGDGKPEFLRAVALTVARSLDGAVQQKRHDLVSPLAQRLVDIGARLFPQKPAGDVELSEDDKRAQVLQLMQGGAAGGA